MFFAANEEQPIAQDWTWLDALSGPIDEDVVRAVDEKPAEVDRLENDQLVG
jgi:antitoxin VapB